ncbi:hypothetical protein CEP54_014317, partial [Fusarium duplospermum]
MAVPSRITFHPIEFLTMSKVIDQGPVVASCPSTIETSIPFLSRDKLYQHTKPYGADFPTDGIEGAEIANHIFETRPVTVYDVRSLDEPLDLETNGACFIKGKTSLARHEASITTTPAISKYADEVMAILRSKFPHYVELRFMDFQVRKRSLAFPDGHGQRVEFAQPATMPHTDFSVKGGYLRMGDVFPNQLDNYKERHFDLLKDVVWRVLAGPNDDWPLAVCDYTSVNIEHDITTNDALHINRVGENWLLYPNKTHRWFYLSGMEEDDLIVFRNTDSKGKLSRKLTSIDLMVSGTILTDKSRQAVFTPPSIIQSLLALLAIVSSSDWWPSETDFPPLVAYFGLGLAPQCSGGAWLD